MYTKTNPYHAQIKERVPLTAPSSTKKTYHISLDISDSTLDFQVGDSIGLLPTNDPAVVHQILHKLNATGHEKIVDPRSNVTHLFRDYLLFKANISKVSLHKLIGGEKTALPLLELVNDCQVSPADLCKVLLPLLPRFYSIASSPKVFPNEIHLTVAFVHHICNGQIYFGVGSHFLCEQAVIGATPIPIYVQPSHGFTLPPDPSASIILIGPGTGIAPFRAFIQERLATQANGRNWLFFGERNRASDFYYADFWLELEKQGRIRLDTAFSRDQPEKIYVQSRMLEQKKSLWNWIEQGSYIYICGDAGKMAKEVDSTLQRIVHEEGGLTEEEARHYLKKLRLEKRYLLDVY